MDFHRYDRTAHRVDSRCDDFSREHARRTQKANHPSNPSFTLGANGTGGPMDLDHDIDLCPSCNHPITDHYEGRCYVPEFHESVFGKPCPCGWEQ